LAGSALCASATSVTTLLAGRLLQAVGAGAGAALVRTIARDAYGPDQLVRAIAYLTMFYTLGPMIAPIAGGLLIDAFGWRSVFGFALAAGGAITLGAYLAIWETRPPAARAAAPVTNPFSDLGALFSNLRFTCFVLQTGFNTGAFFVAASASSILMKETLNRPASEFGFWFLCFPLGFLTGNFVSSRIGPAARNEDMVLIGATLAMFGVLLQAGLFLGGLVTPLTIFLPGFVITFAQGISLPYGQAGAISAVPRIAGTASGVGIAVQNLVGASFAQLFGALADGTVVPIVIATCLSAGLGLLIAVPPVLARARA
ncbi:MAG TPA: MFS transporter, partial [Beijerinckiaceae bacterium]